MKELFSPFDLYDGLCTVAIFIGSMIAAGGGLGGGGVFVPIYILILSFSTKNAAALSQATIFGGSLVNLAMNWTAKHPKRKHRPITDFATLLVFEPMLLVGTVIGVLLNVIFPAMLILILLIVTLVYATVRTTRKGYHMWQTESKALEPPNVSGYITAATGPSVTDDCNVLQGYDTTDSLNGNTHSLTHTETDSALTQYNDKEWLLKPGHKNSSDSYGSLENEGSDQSVWTEMARMCGVDESVLNQHKIDILWPLIEKETQIWKPMAIITIVWIISCATAIGKSSDITGVESCSALYWVITFLSFPLLFVISFVIVRRLFTDYDKKESSNGWLAAEGDIKWNKSLFTMIKYPLIAMFAGLLGGLLGIGGGMIVSPLLMELGVLPSVAAATSAMAVLITSSSATLQYLLLGYLNLDYTFYFMGIGIVGTVIGQTVVTYCIKLYGRKSLIVFSVAAIMGGAVLLMGIDGILQVVDGISWAFSPAC